MANCIYLICTSRSPQSLNWVFFNMPKSRREWIHNSSAYTDTHTADIYSTARKLFYEKIN